MALLSVFYLLSALETAPIPRQNNEGNVQVQVYNLQHGLREVEFCRYADISVDSN